MADIIDNANEAAEIFRNVALRNHYNAQKPQTATGECVDCGNDIEPIRVTHGFMRCFECQSRFETKSRLFGNA